MSVILIAVGVLSAFINNTAAVAMFIPIVLGVARDKKISPSKLLIPVSVRRHPGGHLHLHRHLDQHHRRLDPRGCRATRRFGMFEFSISRHPCFLSLASAICWYSAAGCCRSGGAQEDLTAGYHLREYLTELVILPRSRLIGKTLKESDLSLANDIQVLEIRRDKERLASLLHAIELAEDDRADRQGQHRQHHAGARGRGRRDPPAGQVQRTRIWSRRRTLVLAECVISAAFTG